MKIWSPQLSESKKITLHLYIYVCQQYKRMTSQTEIKARSVSNHMLLLYLDQL